MLFSFDEFIVSCTFSEMLYLPNLVIEYEEMVVIDKLSIANHLLHFYM